MEENTLFIPRLDWLIGGSRIGGSYNQYFGSVGTDPLKGFDETLFNYTVYIEKLESGTEVIRSAVYMGERNFSSRSEEELESEAFECSDEGLQKVREFVLEKLAEKRG